VTPGWAELLAWMQQQSAGGTLDAEAAWDAFRAVVATSEHAALPELCARFHAAPARDRLALAGTIASLLAPVEWPTSWRDARLGLVNALDALVRETAPDSIPFDLTLDERDLYHGGWTDLALARDLLRVPCRRDELRWVAKLCDAGNFGSSAKAGPNHWAGSSRAHAHANGDESVFGVRILSLRPEGSSGSQ
jgi:hypothetical protein